MRVVVKDMWSPDVDPPGDGRPADETRFSVFVQVVLGPPDSEGGETFDFTVASPAALREGFVGRTLVVGRFDWTEVRGYVEHRVAIDAAHSDTWDQLIARLSPFMAHSE